jgi:hypothetical protein
MSIMSHCQRVMSFWTEALGHSLLVMEAGRQWVKGLLPLQRSASYSPAFRRCHQTLQLSLSLAEACSTSLRAGTCPEMPLQETDQMITRARWGLGAGLCEVTVERKRQAQVDCRIVGLSGCSVLGPC